MIDSELLRRQYNELRDTEAPEDIFLPDALPVPESLEHYKQLSGITWQAWEHARWVGWWFHEYDQERQGLLPSRFHIEAMSFSLIGLQLANKVLTDCYRRGDFKLFEEHAIGGDPYSFHLKLLNESRQQMVACYPTYIQFAHLDLYGMRQLEPAQFLQRCGQLKSRTWHDRDTSDHVVLAIDSELVRIEAALRRSPPRAPNRPVYGYLDLAIDRDKLTISRKGHHKAVDDIPKLMWPLAVAMIEAGERGLTDAEAKQVYDGEWSGKRAMKGRLKDRLLPLAITIEDDAFRIIDDRTA